MRTKATAASSPAEEKQETKLHRLIHFARRQNCFRTWERVIRRIESKGECAIVDKIFGRLPLHSLAFSSTVSSSARIAQKCREAVEMCLEKYPEALQARDMNGHTALHLACRSSARNSDDDEEVHGITYKSDTEVVRLLITPPLGDPELVCAFSVKQEEGVRGYLPCETDGEAEEVFSTPLHAACECRPSVNLLKVLVGGSYGRKAMGQRDGQGQMPIHVAVDFAASEPAVRFLVEEWNRSPDNKKCSLNKTGLEDYLPLHFACNPGVDEETFTYIVRTKPDNIWKKAGDDFDLPIHLAVCAMDERESVFTKSATIAFKVQVLLNTAGLNTAGNTKLKMVRTKNKYVQTPLHVACSHMWADQEIVKKFLDICPQLSGGKDSDGNTPLHLAAQHLAPIDVLQTLIKHERRKGGTVGMCATLLMKNRAGNLPLDLVKDVEPEDKWRERHTQNTRLLAGQTKLERTKKKRKR